MASSDATTVKAPSGGPLSAVSSYFKGVMAEFRQISWPTRPQVITETFVVILVVALFSGIISLIDVICHVVIGLIT